MDFMSTLVLIIVIGLFFIAFPIYAARTASSRGRKGWAKATYITIFIGYGWLVGIIALMQKPIRNDIDLDVECPKCQGTKGSTWTGLVDKNTGEPTFGLLLAILWAVLALVTIGGGLWMAISIWQEGDSGFIQWTYGPTIAGFAYLAIGIGIGRYGVNGVREYMAADRVTTSLYKCSGCQHQWADL